MDNEDYYDVSADVHFQVADTTQLTDSDISQDRTSSTCGGSGDVQRHCSEDYKLAQNIKAEDEQLEAKREDGTCIRPRHSVDSCLKTGLETVKKTEEISDQEDFLQFQDTEQLSPWTDGCNELIKVKQEKIDPDECGRDVEETRHWVVCEGGVLKEVKVEHTPSATETNECCSENVDKNQHFNSEKPFSCNTCGKSFKIPKQLKRHKMIHTGVKPYVCDICGKSFIRSTHLKNHKRTHTGEKPYTCHTCQKSFTHLSTLRHHEMTHTGEKPFTCDMCRKSFKSSSHLKQHEMTHTDEKPYTCDTCGKSFRLLNTLKNHEMTHTGDKPFTCDMCGKSFTHFSSLKRHEMTHTGEKPYICDTCGKSFTQSCTLKQHVMTHTGEKPYICDTCGKKFRQSCTLKQHEMTHTVENKHSLVIYPPMWKVIQNILSP